VFLAIIIDAYAEVKGTEHSLNSVVDDLSDIVKENWLRLKLNQGCFSVGTDTSYLWEQIANQ
jgi:hypothetical protein